MTPESVKYYDRTILPSLRWGAILGGTVVAIGIHLLLITLGLGLGFATFANLSPGPAEKFSIIGALIWSGCALVALWCGGTVAGRFSQSVDGGFVHGLLVWGLTLILTLLVLSAGTGMVLGGALKVFGAGLGIGGKAVVAGLEDTATEGVRRNGEQLGSFIEEALKAGPTNATPAAAARARREVTFAVTKFFAPGYDIDSPLNHAPAVAALTTYGGMNREPAATMLNDWVVSYKSLQAELANAKLVAEQNARRRADEAAKKLSGAALWSFSSLVIGLLVAGFSGSAGARQALRVLGSTAVVARPPVGSP